MVKGSGSNCYFSQNFPTLVDCQVAKIVIDNKQKLYEIHGYFKVQNPHTKKFLCFQKPSEAIEMQPASESATVKAPPHRISPEEFAFETRFVVLNFLGPAAG